MPFVLCRNMSQSVMQILANAISPYEAFCTALKVVSVTFLLVCFIFLKESNLKQGKMFFILPQKLFLFLR